MAYRAPGTTVTEQIPAGAANIATQINTPCVIAIGDRQKRVTNEEQVRGEVVGETLTVSGTPPYSALLVNRSNRSLSSTTIYRDGSALSDAYVSFDAPFVLGTNAGPYNITTNLGLGLSLDGLPFVTIRFISGAPAVAVVGGTQVNVTASFGGAGAAATRAEIAGAINGGLNALGAIGYGAAYAAVATDATTGIRITSPNSGPTANVSVTDPVADFTGVTLSALSAPTTLFGAPAAGNRNAQSYITLSSLVYSATSVYTATYVNIDSTADTLDQTPVLSIVRVGSFQNVADFEALVDYQQTSNTVDWSILTASVFTGTVATPYAVNMNDNLRLSIDGRTAVTLDLNGGGAGIHGYTNPAAPASATAAEVAANINALIANSSAYGLGYRAVASVSGTFVRLTSPTLGEAGSVQILAPTTLSATQVIFGLAPASLPYTPPTGVGSRPTVGSAYFVTYQITRATTDYDVQKTYFSLDSARDDLGFAGVNNPLMAGVEVAFQQAAPQVAVVQVNDTTAGSPTRTQYQNALAATVITDVATDIIVLSTDLAVQTDLRDNIERYSSADGARWRRGWFGMPRSTSPGDRDTASTFVFRASRTLQVAAESPARGRLLLVAPPQLTGVSRTYTLENGNSETVSHDSTILAVALAARRSTFTSPSDTLSKKFVSGFNTSDVTLPWSPTESGIMASQGVMVVSYDAGNFSVLDPVTTEAAGGALDAFLYDSTSPQKDNVTRKIVQASNGQLIGRVPASLSDFVVDVKLVFAGVISGEIGRGNIGPFRTDAGTVRGIDLNRDITVVRDPNSQVRYLVRYSFNLRYPALRVDATFSVDSPFISST